MGNSQICEIPYYPAIVPLGVYAREMKTYVDVKTCTQISITDNMKKKETTQMSINRWMIKQNMVDPHNMI